MYTQVILDS